MTLEPTDEQINALALYMVDLKTAGVTADRGLRLVWCHIRDMVLEAAAERCETVRANDDNPDWQEAATTCAEVIRAMKGKP